MCAVYGNERMSCLSPVQLEDMAREGWRAGGQGQTLRNCWGGRMGAGAGVRAGGWVRLSSTSDLWTQLPPGRGIQEERGGADMKTVECGAN